MSLKDLDEFVAELPYAIREQVSDYARSVRDASVDICRDAGVSSSEALIDSLMWLAALRRLHAIVSSAFWTVDGANNLLRQQDGGVASVGSTDYSPESPMYSTLAVLNREVETLIRRLDVAELVRLPWSEVAQVLTDERRRG